MRKVIVLVAVLALGTAAVAGNILPGFDHLKTQSTSIWDFPDDPTDPGYIDGDYFGPGSDPFEGQVTIICPTTAWRSKPAEFLDPTAPVTVETEIVALSLHSVAPIEVTYNGGATHRLFDVFIGLNPAAASTGEYILEHNAAGLPDGGLMQIDSFFDVFFEIEFTPVDGGVGPLAPLYRSQRLVLTEPVPWSHTAPPLYDFGDSGGFFPGVDPFAEPLPDDYVPQMLVFQGSELTWHVRLDTIPEPATLALLAFGAAALRRRRR